MEMVNLVQLTVSDKEACNYLQSLGVLKNYTKCLYCDSKRIGFVQRCIYKCYKCNREWSPRRGSVLEETRINYSKFLVLVKLFELEISAHRASKELGMSYTTLFRFYNMIREGIYIRVIKEDGQLESIEVCKGCCAQKCAEEAEGKIPVFGIIEREGKVKVEIIQDMSEGTLLKETIKKANWGSIIYTEQYKGYDTLLTHKDYFRHLMISNEQQFVDDNLYINRIEGFLCFIKERLVKFYGISSKYFLYYLKELEFRYNHRNEDLYTLILTSIPLVNYTI